MPDRNTAPPIGGEMPCFRVSSLLLNGLDGRGGLRAKKDKKGKKGAKNSHVFLPLFALLVRFCFSSAFQSHALNRE
jgi:hypothetical protein